MLVIRKALFIIAIMVFAAGLLSGCGKGSRLQVSYPDVGLNEPLQTSTALYRISVDEETGKLLLYVESAPRTYASVTFRIFVSSDLLTQEADSQIALDLRQGQSHTFVLPFTESDLPITVNYVEQFAESDKLYDVKDEITNTWGFTVGKKAMMKEKIQPKIEDITPEKQEYNPDIEKV